MERKKDKKADGPTLGEGVGLVRTFVEAAAAGAGSCSGSELAAAGGGGNALANLAPEGGSALQCGDDGVAREAASTRCRVWCPRHRGRSVLPPTSSQGGR